MRYRDLPPTPPRPHSFFDLERKRGEAILPGRAQPVGISYVETGVGEPLLLVHGLMTDAYSFRYVIPELARHYRVIVPDLPGAGRSDAPRDLSMAPDSMAEVLDAFLRALEIPRAYVVGNSLGGYLSLWFALRHPERVERLMILHAPGFPEFRLRAMKLFLGTPLAKTVFRRLTRHPEQFVTENVHYRDPSTLSQEEVREYATIFKDPVRTEIFLRVLSESMDPSIMSALPDALARRRDSTGTRVPIRLLWSRQDALVSPEFGPRYQAMIPDAELIWVDQSSHFLQVDSPERTVAEILRFGAKVP